MVLAVSKDVVAKAKLAEIQGLLDTERARVQKLQDAVSLLMDKLDWRDSEWQEAKKVLEETE